MSYSFNELKSLAVHASRGAGFAWGIAEEAAFATLTLCKHNLDGAHALVTLLQQPEQIPATCPLLNGIKLVDHARLNKCDEIGFDTLTLPLFMLPFMMNLARLRGQIISLKAGKNYAETDGNRLALKGDLWGTQGVILQPISRMTYPPLPICQRATPSLQDLEQLRAFAAKTYAPATTQSRLKGAGFIE